MFSGPSTTHAADARTTTASAGCGRGRGNCRPGPLQVRAASASVTENPFALAQYVLQAWGSLGGWGLPWLRLVPLAYGLATYAVLRWLLAVALDRVARRPLVPWALAGAHLLWFLGYGITLRPEPLIVLGTAVTWLLVELARRRRDRSARR